MKATAIAPSNVAFIKYWGKKDEKLRLPTNGSFSMNLSKMITTTTVEFSTRNIDDIVIINQEKVDGEKKARVIDHLDRIRKLADVRAKAKVVSINNFPTSTGLSSSASGFAALTVAASQAAGLKLNEKELSILTRQASGSACRSIPSGFVEWLEGRDSQTSYAVSIYPPKYWDIYDVVVVVGSREKEMATTDSQKMANTNPFFAIRLANINEKIIRIKKYLREKDFKLFGQLVEDEALELHAIIMTSKPSMLYWYPETIEVIQLVRKWRSEGLSVYFTINTGHDVHIICEKENLEKLLKKLKQISVIKNIIVNKPCEGARLLDNHLF